MTRTSPPSEPPSEPPSGPPSGPPSDAPGPSPRRSFRVLQRVREGSQGGTVVDVQLQVRRTGALVWAHTFSDPDQADALVARIEQDLDELDDEAFRRAHRVASDA